MYQVQRINCNAYGHPRFFVPCSTISTFCDELIERLAQRGERNVRRSKQGGVAGLVITSFALEPHLIGQVIADIVGCEA